LRYVHVEVGKASQLILSPGRVAVCSKYLQISLVYSSVCTMIAAESANECKVVEFSCLPLFKPIGIIFRQV